MRTTITLAAALSAATIELAAPASAEPPVNTDGSGHVHHVWLGNVACHQIDAVSWDAADRGLHRGADSSGSASGPWHGACPE